MTNGELDILIAEHVMGWKRYEGRQEIVAAGLTADFADGGRGHYKLVWAKDGRNMACHDCGSMPEFSSDPEASKQVRDKMREDGFWFRLQGPFSPDRKDGYFAGFTPHETTGWNGIPDHWTEADTEERAVALAALEAKGITVAEATAT